MKLIFALLLCALCLVSCGYVSNSDEEIWTAPSSDVSSVITSQDVSVTLPQELSDFETSVDEQASVSEVSEENNVKTVEIIVNDYAFTAKLYDNDTATAFSELLPLTIDMKELNGNEKYYYLDDALPTDSKRPNGIQAGDIMLFGNSCVVLFYESFSTSYSYTPIGRIEDPERLSDALGRGNVQVTFSLK